MIVVSDTSPLNYLVLIDTVEILPRIFKCLAVPPAVIEELTHPGSPVVVRSWANAPPNWLMIQEPMEVVRIPGLGLGESAAISLAEEQQAAAE